MLTREARTMDHDYLDRLKHNHPTWRLLNADNAALIISLLFRVFVHGRQHSVAHPDLVATLDDTLFGLRKTHGDNRYPCAAKEYLDGWSSGATPYLRKYYVDTGDDPEYDLTPDTERAIEWLRTLRERQFVGTESRLLMVFQLLRDIVRRAKMLAQLLGENLPRHQARFKQLLTEGTINSVALFQSHLDHEQHAITKKIAAINLAEGVMFGKMEPHGGQSFQVGCAVARATYRRAVRRDPAGGYRASVFRRLL